MIIVANSDILGKNLKYLRQSKSLTLSQMADLIDMEEDALLRLEEGREFEIDLYFLERLQQYFDVDYQQLFERLLNE